MKSKALIALLMANGWEVFRIEGSHHVMRKKGHPQNLSMPHPKKDLKTGLVAQIKRKAGLR